MTLTEACNILHIDEGMNNDLVGALLDAIPDYIETSTGLTATQQSSEPLVETVTGFLLTQWYYADHADDQALTRTINSLLKVLSIRARDYEE